MKSTLMMKKNRVLILLAGFGFLFFFGCSSGAKISSGWVDNEIKVDGSISEWNKIMNKIPDRGISVGFRNDDKFLYLCFAADNRARIMMLIRNGMIIWFEPESGDKNLFGIRYPMPSAEFKSSEYPEMTGAIEREENFEKMIKNFLEQQKEFQILNSDRFPLTALPIMNNEGIEAGLQYNMNQLTYELKIPLLTRTGYSFRVDASPGGKIRINFESENVLGDNKGGLKSIGMSGGGPESYGGGRGSRRGIAGGYIMEPLKYSVELNLVDAPKVK
ncbi:MAG: hypothetical protein CVV24_09020 [Ignavibacteriae bacterium HGW-Ignavibacteriae-3]|nr:MAG: hypothetical protein CVV24_09020 [Ignavibacteriae bacterium HGW-Ignavibacteriae-3]